MKYILKRLLKEPVETTVQWKELEPYKNRRFVLKKLRRLKIIRVIPMFQPTKKYFFFLNIQNRFLTTPKIEFYFEEIDKLVMEKRLKPKSKRISQTSIIKQKHLAKQKVKL